MVVREEWLPIFERIYLQQVKRSEGGMLNLRYKVAWKQKWLTRFQDLLADKGAVELRFLTPADVRVLVEGQAEDPSLHLAQSGHGTADASERRPVAGGCVGRTSTVNSGTDVSSATPSGSTSMA